MKDNGVMGIKMVKGNKLMRMEFSMMAHGKMEKKMVLGQSKSWKEMAFRAISWREWRMVLGNKPLKMVIDIKATT